jgi:hypothetical protein
MIVISSGWSSMPTTYLIVTSKTTKALTDLNDNQLTVREKRENKQQKFVTQFAKLVAGHDIL